LSEAVRKNATRIVQTLVNAGHTALFAGGCVRDMLMGRQPEDYDIATSASPEAVMGLFERTISVGARFGVVVVVMDGVNFEVATFRSEADYADGRHPGQVSFTDARGDVQRRDFTINGMLYDPLAERVLDYVDGQEDIRRKLIRCIGDPVQRFSEDHLRMLRAIRFAARFGYSIEPATAEAIRQLAERIGSVSAERIGQELCKMITGPSPRAAVEWMNRTGLLERILPEVAAMRGVEQPEQFHPEGDVYAHTLRMLELMDAEREDYPPTCEFALGVMLHDVGKPSTFERADRVRFNLHAQVGRGLAAGICRRLCLSNDQTQRVCELVDEHMRVGDAPRMRDGRLRQLMLRDSFADMLQLHRLDCLASHGDLSSWEYCRRKQTEFAGEPAPLPRLLTGRDLIAMGYEPGPVFTRILNAVEEAQLDGVISTPAEAQRLARERFPPPNPSP
jgi:poly(A) polymerase